MPSSPPLNQNGNDVDDTVEDLENLIGDAYNNVNLSGAGTDLEFFTPNGGNTAVKSITLPTGSGTGQNFEAFNSVSESGGVYTFGTNYGNTIGTTIDIGGITTNSANISGLSSTVGTHTTDISDIRSRVGSNNLNNAISDLENNTGSTTLKGLVDGHDSAIATNASDISTLSTTVGGHTTDIDEVKDTLGFDGIVKHPTLTNYWYLSHTVTYNAKTWIFDESSTNGYPGSGHDYHSFRAFGDQGLATGAPPVRYWKSMAHANHEFTTANGSYYDYSGTASLGGISGEWLLVQLPDPALITNFTFCAAVSENLPRSFKLIASNDGTNYDILGEYDDVTVSTADEGSNFKIDQHKGIYYNYFAIVVTKIDKIASDDQVAIRWLRYYTPPDIITHVPRNDSSFYDATITGTNTLNLISDSGTKSLTLPGGTTTASAVDAITINIDISISTPHDYTVNNIQRMPIELLLGHKYIFNYPSLHPLKLSTTEDGTHNGGVEYTDGRVDTITTPAAAVGVYWQFELFTQSDTTLYYYCSLHSDMGGPLIRSNGYNNIKRNGFTYDTSASPPKVIIERENGYSAYTQELNLSDSFIAAQKDGDNIKLTTISGAQTTVGPFSGGGGASSTTNYPTSAMTSNALPAPLVAVGSTSYNLFTDKKFGSDNLGNIGTFGDGNHEIQQWAYDVSDGNVIVTTHDGANTRFVKITLDGNLVMDIGGVGNRGKYVLSSEIVYTSAADLIADYNSAGSSVSAYGYGFNKHALFDLAVNESKAYHAFDEVATTEWVSNSNTYDVTTGNYGNVFSGTPPSRIDFTDPTGTGVWFSSGTTNYYWGSEDRTSTFVRYTLFLKSNNTYVNANRIHGATFEITTSGLMLNVNDTSHTGGNPSANPDSFKINGGATVYTTATAVNVGDTIDLLNGGSNSATFVVPTELAVFESKLSTTTDAGEYIKLDLGSAVEATTLTLKSVVEYKEPRLNITGYSQCGYEVTASSEATGFHAHRLFDNLTTGSADFGAANQGFWLSGASTYVSSGGEYISTGTQLSASSSTVTGEWIKLKLPDKRKLVGYKLTRRDTTGTDETPKKFRIYGSNDDSTWSEISGSSQDLTTPIERYATGGINTGGTRFDIGSPSPAYQYYALVIETLFNYTHAVLMEMQLFCQPSEIEEFKLYASPDDVAWTEIHSQTSANITSSGTDFTITNPNSYQHYGLVVTKNGGYHNVSLGEMKLGVTETVDLTNYYTKPEVNSLLPKGVLAEGSFTYVKNNSNSFAVAQANFFAASSNIGWSSSNIQIYSRTFGNPATWAYAPACRQLIYQFTFTSPILDDAEQETSDYKVMLTRRDISLSFTDTIYELAVYEKTPDYFKVRIELEVDTSTYNIETHGFDFVVF